MVYMDNMAAVAMKGGSTSEQYMYIFSNLTNNNKTLAKTIDKQQKELTDLCRENNSLQKKFCTAVEPGGIGNERKSVESEIVNFSGCRPSYRWVKSS